MRMSALKRRMIAAAAVSAFALGSAPALAAELEPEDQVSFVYLTITFDYDTLLDLLRLR